MVLLELFFQTNSESSRYHFFPPRYDNLKFVSHWCTHKQVKNRLLANVWANFFKYCFLVKMSYKHFSKRRVRIHYRILKLQNGESNWWTKFQKGFNFSEKLSVRGAGWKIRQSYWICHFGLPKCDIVFEIDDFTNPYLSFY